MSLKKEPQADLEQKRSLFLLIGLAVALLLVLIAFEWNFGNSNNYELGEYNVDEVEEEIIPITRMTEPPPPPKVKPPPPPPPPPTQFEETEKETEEDPEFNSEDDEDTKQEDYEEDEEDPPAPSFFTIVEQMPAFKGCESKSGYELTACNNNAISRYLTANIIYPNLEREAEIEGKVYISFIVNETGKTADIKILKSGTANFDKESIRVIKNMPKWTPGKQRGKAVKVQQTIPITFGF